MHPVRPVGGPMKSKEKSVRPAGGPMKSQEEEITPGVAGSFYFLSQKLAKRCTNYWPREIGLCPSH